MDILFQYLNIRKRKQEYVRVLDVPCSTLYSALELEMANRALVFVDYMQKTYQSSYMFVGIFDADYCNRKPCAVFSYADFCQLTCGLDEVSSID